MNRMSTRREEEMIGFPLRSNVLKIERSRQMFDDYSID
jgi:hypothetical protein